MLILNSFTKINFMSSALFKNVCVGSTTFALFLLTLIIHTCLPGISNLLHSWHDDIWIFFEKVLSSLDQFYGEKAVMFMKVLRSLVLAIERWHPPTKVLEINALLLMYFCLQNEIKKG